ncbi:MAG: HAD-IA family hydrolase [Planctomycetes bacterium]|nr:HAD-IA family hydrolase [Planctomycetota bacterium]
MAIKAVFLDAGGTLLAEKLPRAAIYANVARELGVSATEAALRPLLSRIAGEMPRTAGGGFRYSEAWFGEVNARVFGREFGLSDAAVAHACRLLFAHFAEPANFRVYDGAIELVAELKARGLVVGVVSNWSERLEGLLVGLGLRQHLDLVVVSAVERCEKPERTIFARALARAGAEPTTTLHVGNDVEKDARGATEAGLQTVLVDHHGEIEPGPFPCVRGLGELRAWILERCP